MLGVVVVNYQSQGLLRRNLAAVDLSPTEALVVVVDNFSSASELSAVRQLCEEQGWKLLSSPTNVGFGSAMNLGVDAALAGGCDTLLLLNPDVRIGSSSALSLARRCRLERKSMISPVILRPDGSTWFCGSVLDPRSGRVGRVNGPFRSGPGRWLTGASLAMHASLWTELGGFAPGYFLYWEDIDLSRVCVERGGMLIVDDDIHAEHEVGATQRSVDRGGRGKSTIYYYYNCRNRLLFATRHLGTRQILGWLIRTPSESTAILLRGGRRQLLSSPTVMVAAAAGSVVGTAMVLRELMRRAFHLFWHRSSDCQASGRGADRIEVA